MTTSTDSDWTGKEFGHYKILGKLGRGGMGVVYVAQDQKLDRQVALKVLPPEMASDLPRIQRFQREAKAIASLSHPNIVTIFSVEESNSISFITMELVRGQTISKLIPPQGMPLNQFLRLAVPIADAVSAAHLKGIIHRDLKPENIMVTDEGRVKILDFGLAKLKPQIPDSSESLETQLVMPDHSLTEDGVILGTVLYMSPEQAEGKPLDARSDIFSLGVIFYHMLTGRLPFQGQSAASIISAILRDQPPSVTQLNRTVPPDAARIVKHCLQKDPERRYQSALDIRNELEELADEQKSGERVTIGTRTEPQKKTITRISLLSSVVMIAAVIILIRLAYQKDDPGPFVADQFVQITAEPGQEQFPSISPDGKMILYASRAADNWDIYTKRVGGENVVNLTADSAADDIQPSFSPDGNRIAFQSSRENGGLFLMGSTGESVLRLTNSGYNPAWSPDGKKLFYATEAVMHTERPPRVSELWSVEIETQKKQLVYKGDALQPSISPDGSRLAYWGYSKDKANADIFTISAKGGDPIAVTVDVSVDWNPLWSPDGKYLYFCSDRGGAMNLWRIAIDETSGKTNGTPEPVTSGTAAIGHPTISKDGRTLAYVARVESRNILKAPFDPANLTVAPDLSWVTQGSKNIAYPDVSPDGQWIAYNSLGKEQHLFIVRPDGTGTRQLTTGEFRDWGPRWHPDGKHIAFCSTRSGKFEIWTIAPDGSRLSQLSRYPRAHYPVWDPSGTRISFSFHSPNGNVIFSPFDRKIKLFELPPLPNPERTFEAWSWSPNGEMLAGMDHLPSGEHVGIILYSIPKKTFEWLTNFGEMPIWLKDGKSILFADKGKLFSVDVENKQTRHINIPSSPQIAGAFALSPDQKSLYSPIDTTLADIWMIQMKSAPP